MKNYKVVANGKAIDVEHNINEEFEAIMIFNTLVSKGEWEKVYVMSNVTGELIATYDVWREANGTTRNLWLAD